MNGNRDPVTIIRSLLDLDEDGVELVESYLAVGEEARLEILGEAAKQLTRARGRGGR